MRGFAIVFAGEGADAHGRAGRWRDERPVVCGRARMCIHYYNWQAAGKQSRYRGTTAQRRTRAAAPRGELCMGHTDHPALDMGETWTWCGRRTEGDRGGRRREKARKKERLRVPVRRRPGRVISSVSVCSIATRGWLARQRARFAADGLSDGNLAKADLYPRILAAAVGAGGISGATRAREGWRGCGMQLAVFGQRSQSRVGCGRAACVCTVLCGVRMAR